MVSKVFLHFLDNEVASLYRLTSRFSTGRMIREFGLAIKYAYLLSQEAVIVPQGFYFESEIARAVIEDAHPIINTGELKFAASELELGEFLYSKRLQYQVEPDRHRGYFSVEAENTFTSLEASAIRREYSSSNAIRRGWESAAISRDGFLSQMVRHRKLGLFEKSRMERKLMAMPTMLGEKAFIWDYIKPFMPINDLSGREQQQAELSITMWYVESYLHEYEASIIIDLPMSDLSCGFHSDSEYCISLSKLRLLLNRFGVRDSIESLDWGGLIQLKASLIWPLFQDFLKMSYRSPTEALSSVLQSGLHKNRVHQLGAPVARAGFGTLVDEIQELVRGHQIHDPFGAFAMPGKIDWLNAIGEGVVTLAGPLGAPLKVLLEARKDQRRSETHRTEMTEATVNPANVAGIVAAELARDPAWIPRVYEAVVFGITRGGRDDFDPSNLEKAQVYLSSLQSRLTTLDLTALRRDVVKFFPEAREIRLIAEDAGIPTGSIDFQGSADLIWSEIFRFLRGNSPIYLLLLLYEIQMRKQQVPMVSRYLTGE